MDWFAPYARALRKYRERKRLALTACIDAGLPLAQLAGKCALELELLLERACAAARPVQGSLFALLAALVLAGCGPATGPRWIITPSGPFPQCRLDKTFDRLYPLPCFVMTQDGPILLRPTQERFFGGLDVESR